MSNYPNQFNDFFGSMFCVFVFLFQIMCHPVWSIVIKIVMMMMMMMIMMRGEFLETAPYWAGVVSVRLGAIAGRRSFSIPVSGVQCEFDSQSISCFIRRLELSYIICSHSCECLCRVLGGGNVAE